MDAADESSDFLTWAEATNVGDLTVEQIHSELHCIAQSYLKVPMFPLLNVHADYGIAPLRCWAAVRSQPIRVTFTALLVGH
jgi:hypothetical protein